MKFKCIFFAVFIGILTLLSSFVYAQDIDAVLEDALTDNLTETEDIKWYCFEMNEPGDAIITIHGLQDYWDGWDSNWYAVVYASDLQTILAEGYACAYNDQYSPPTEFSLTDLESGEYYIQISSASTEYFTADAYRLELDRIYSPAQPPADPIDSIYMMGTEPFSDRLVSEDQIQWYSFEMDEYGDAIIYITGQQENWDGYVYHWRCAIYKDDMETSIAYTDVRGYTGTYGPGIISAPDLDAGMYYVKVTSVSSVNPFMTTFTSAPYEIQLVRYYHPSSGTYLSSELRVFQNAGDVLWALDGTAFIKRNAGESLGALMQSKSGAVVPVLISTDKSAVEYTILGTGEKITSGGPWHHEYSGIDYYYSDCGSVSRYTNTPIEISSLPMLYVDTNQVVSAVEIIADVLWPAEADGFDEPEPDYQEEAGAGNPAGVGSNHPEGTGDGNPVGAGSNYTGGTAAAGQAGTGTNIRGEAEDNGETELTEKDDKKGAILVGIIFGLLVILGITVKKRPNRSYNSSSYSSGSGYSSGYSGGYSSSFQSAKRERSFTEGGPTGCGIGGSFCGCGSGR